MPSLRYTSYRDEMMRTYWEEDRDERENLFLLEDEVVELMLKFLICIIDAQLLKASEKTFKRGIIKGTKINVKTYFAQSFRIQKYPKCLKKQNQSTKIIKERQKKCLKTLQKNKK
jgi:hypothetical protein